jgi:hypothetical protein
MSSPLPDPRQLIEHLQAEREFCSELIDLINRGYLVLELGNTDEEHRFRITDRGREARLVNRVRPLPSARRGAE